MFQKEDLKSVIVSHDDVVFGIGDDKNSAWADMLSFVNHEDPNFADMPRDFCNAIAFLKVNGYSAEYATEKLIKLVGDLGGDIVDKISVGKTSANQKVFCLSEELTQTYGQAP